MTNYSSDKLRNIVVGPRRIGKTSLADAMLFDTGAVNRRPVDDGTSVADGTRKSDAAGCRSTLRYPCEWRNQIECDRHARVHGLCGQGDQRYACGRRRLL
jgi:hypothetical protein